MQEVHVAVGDDAVHDQSSQCRSSQQKELHKKRYDDDAPKQTGVFDKILHISPHRLALVRHGFERAAGFECQSHSRKGLAELLRAYKPTARSRIDDIDAAVAYSLEHDEMRKVPVENGSSLEK